VQVKPGVEAATSDVFQPRLTFGAVSHALTTYSRSKATRHSICSQSMPWTLDLLNSSQCYLTALVNNPSLAVARGRPEHEGGMRLSFLRLSHSVHLSTVARRSIIARRYLPLATLQGPQTGSSKDFKGQGYGIEITTIVEFASIDSKASISLG
jgi:hypothetical protein